MGAIRRLFSGRTRLSKKGEYRVSLWDWGTRDWRTFHIDDRFACRSADDPDVMFAKMSTDGEIFPMLLEKAVAIMAGGFDFCNQIMPTWALGVLTGCPAVYQYERDEATGTWTGYHSEFDGRSTYKSIDSYEGVWPDGSSGRERKSDAAMWKILNDWDESHYMMLCGKTGDVANDTVTTATGIHYIHAYSLLQVRTNIANSGINLAQCRNPHGQGGREPDLPWKDGDIMWTKYPLVAKELEWTTDKHVDDGMFWMSDADFFSTWTTVYMLRCNMEESSRRRLNIPREQMDCDTPVT